VIGTAAQLKSVAAMKAVTVAGTSLPLSHEMKSLGVILDDHLRFDSHARAVAKACTFHTRALRHVRHMLSTELAITIGRSIVATRLDYCNSLLYGAPSTSLDRLQRCQNMLARVVTQSSSRTSAKPLLQSLHWLPIRERIRHKVATLTFKAHRMSSPPLSSLLNDHIPSRMLRPSSTPRLIVPRTRTELAKRAFCVAAPSLWNSLPVDVVDTNTILTFKQESCAIAKMTARCALYK